MIEILEPEDLYEYREAYRNECLLEAYRFDDDENERSDEEIHEYLREKWDFALSDE